MAYSDFPPFCFNWASTIFILGLVANPAPYLITMCHVSNFCFFCLFVLPSHRRERFLVSRAFLYTTRTVGNDFWCPVLFYILLGPFTGVVEFVFMRAFSRA